MEDKFQLTQVLLLYYKYAEMKDLFLFVDTVSSSGLLHNNQWIMHVSYVTRCITLTLHKE